MKHTNRSDRLTRALLSLDGLSIGDAFGGMFFHSEAVEHSEARLLPAPPWDWTDDTLMAVSVVQNLRDFGEIAGAELLTDFVRRFDPVRGYGPTIGGALMRLQESDDNEREVFARLFERQGSFGNGAAMRVAPLGAFFADADLSYVAAQATRSAETTHTHVEGIAGAVAVAVAAVIAWRNRATPLSRPDFLNAVLAETPTSETAAKIRIARDFSPGVSVRFAGAVLGTGLQISAPDTVPFALFCAAEYVTDLREALWQTVSAMGDRDTTCAIVGGIVALSVGADGVPADFYANREPLPPM
ncbi:MAG: ADP-ribosylglycohydrolase family protein [Armatimonadetes bacterium]|nr:ADP-ribosylglycohydrolase family protein [Armatimonadota bacterium]